MPSWGDGNGLELDSGDGCTALTRLKTPEWYTLEGCFMVCELSLNKAVIKILFVIPTKSKVSRNKPTKTCKISARKTATCTKKTT